MLRALACGLLAAILASDPMAAAADAVDSREDAIQSVLDSAEDYGALADRIETELRRPGMHVLMFDTLFGPQVVAISEQQLATLLGYLQVENLLHRDRLTDAAGKASQALGIDPAFARMALEDPGRYLGYGGVAAMQEDLRRMAEEDRPAIETWIADLKAESARLQATAKQIDSLPAWPPGEGGGGKVIAPVQVGGVTVDYCLSWATDCGQPVADEVCRRQGFQRAQSFDWAYMHPTRTLRSGETCDADYCGGLTRVACE